VQFQVPPSNARHEALLTMARGMLEKATLHKDVLVKRGGPFKPKGEPGAGGSQTPKAA